MGEKTKERENGMENKLKALFDFQSFQGNKKLAKMITEAEQSIDCEFDERSRNLIILHYYSGMKLKDISEK